MKKLRFLLALTAVASVFGCAALQPGQDPIVVRCEQLETTAQGGFDLVLNIDNANRALVATNIPAFHGFCEWLRQPQTVEITNRLPRASAMLVSLDDIKLAYKASTISSNSLIEAMATVQATLNQAQSWATVITNLNH